MTFLEETLGFTDTPIKEYESIKKHTTIGVGGVARYFTSPKSYHSVRLLIESAKSHKIPCFILGNGSNILFGDKGYKGLVISTKNLNDISFENGKVKACAGAPIAKLIEFAKNHSLSGIESLSGIPASVGGAITMNAGAFGVSIADKVFSVETIKGGKLCKYYKSDCRFGYRKSRFLISKEIIVSATFDFEVSDKNFVATKIKNQLELRKIMHPLGKSFGSVFRNPIDSPLSAGALIEKAGLKGFRIGGASVSTKHANFIVNDKNATAKDIVLIIEEIKKRVYEKFKVDLKEEVIRVGDF